MENIITLKYPIILVHGIVAHDRGGFIPFWGRIPEKLSENGVKVYYGNTDSLGDYKSNAKILKESIDKVLNETKAEKVNIIAHSKGGIDSRYCIWTYDYGDKVASLTTISTPHNGSEIADLIYKQKKLLYTKKVDKTLKVFLKFYGDINPDPLNVNFQLTTAQMKEFNELVIMDSKVFYQSLYTILKNPFDDILFFYSYLYLKKVSGENDGFISEKSVKWGNNVIKLTGGISHAEILDFKKKKISKIDIPDIYLNIAKGLSEKGF